MTLERADLTSEDLVRMVESRVFLDELAREYFTRRVRLDPQWSAPFSRPPYLDKVYFSPTEVTFQSKAGSCPSGCCGYDSAEFDVPLSHLLMDAEGLSLWLEKQVDLPVQ